MSISSRITYKRVSKKFEEKFILEGRIKEDDLINFVPEENKEHLLLTREGEKIILSDFSLIKIIPKKEIQYFCTGKTESIREIRSKFSTEEKNIEIPSTLYLNNNSIELKSMIEKINSYTMDTEVENYYTVNMIVSVNLKDLEPEQKDIKSKFDLIDI